MARFPFPDGLRFGVHGGQQYTDYPSCVELWRTVEDLGLDWASVFDHFMPIQADPTGPCFEGPTLLAALAAETHRLRIGIIVVGVTYRSPAVLANIATTIDHVSGGRLEFGIGGAWYELEHDQYGIPFPPIGQRLAMMGEAAAILKSLWTEQTTTFDGRHYQLKDAWCEPKPLQSPRIPLWIGGSGERVTMRHVAREADGWNTFLTPLDEFDHKLAVLDGHCRDVGRDRDEIRIQTVGLVVLGEDEREAEDQLRARAAALHLESDVLRERGWSGADARAVDRTSPPVRRARRRRLPAQRAAADGPPHARAVCG